MNRSTLESKIVITWVPIDNRPGDLCRARASFTEEAQLAVGGGEDSSRRRGAVERMLRRDLSARLVGDHEAEYNRMCNLAHKWHERAKGHANSEAQRQDYEQEFNQDMYPPTLGAHPTPGVNGDWEWINHRGLAPQPGIANWHPVQTVEGNEEIGTAYDPVVLDYAGATGVDRPTEEYVLTGERAEAMRLRPQIGPDND